MLTFNGRTNAQLGKRCHEDFPRLRVSLLLTRKRRAGSRAVAHRSARSSSTSSSKNTRGPAIRAPNLREPSNNCIALSGTSATEVEAGFSEVENSCIALIRKRLWKEATRSFVKYGAGGGTGGPGWDTAGRELLQGLCDEGIYPLAWKAFCANPNKEALPYPLYQRLISLALKAESYSQAVDIFEELKAAEYDPNKVTYCTLISGLLRGRRKGSPNVRTAYNLWKKLEESDHVLDAAAYRVGCNACAAMGRLNEAEKFPTVMRQSGFRPDTRLYNILLKGHCQRGNTEAGLKLFKSMKRVGVQADRVTYNTLIHGFVVNGDVSTGKVLMERAAREGITPDVWTRTSLMNGLVKEGSLEDALDVFEDLKKSSWTPNQAAYGTLVNGCVLRGDMKAAQDLVREMAGHKIPPNIVIYNTLLKGLCNTGIRFSVDRVVALLEEMTANGLSPRVDTYNTILSSTMRAQDVESANLILEKMLNVGIAPDAVTYTILFKIYQKDGNLKGCKTLFEKIKNAREAGLDVVAYCAMISCYTRMGSMQEAENLLEEAVEFASSTGSPVPVEAFGAVVSGYAMYNDLPEAIRVFKKFYQLGGQPDVMIFECLLKLCIRKGETAYARKVLRAMEFSGIDISGYSSWMENGRRYIAKSPSAKDQNMELERLKFWMGLPNEFYAPEWP